MAKAVLARTSSPRPERPKSAQMYGVPEAKKPSDYLPWSWAEQRLKKARNYWIATTRPDARPHLMPVWGVWVDGALYFGTDRRSRKARNTMANPAMVAHGDIEDDAVIVEGEAREYKGSVDPINSAYKKKYKMKLTDAPGELFICELRPKVVFAWSEQTFAKKATRFVFS